MTGVTQQHFQRVTGSNPSKHQGNPQKPVEHVTWDQAVKFCRRLSELPQEKAAKRRYGLPTEAQWEHACRAGTLSEYYFGDDENRIGDFAWYGGNCREQSHPVGEKEPNAFGLCDMYGNVWEWCADWYDPAYYANSLADDPTGPVIGSSRVLRGGSWCNHAWGCRSANRHEREPGALNFLGFRVSIALAE